MKIVLDPGHGMGNRNRRVYDPGAVAIHNGLVYQEASIMLAAAKRLKPMLEELGHKVFLTRIDEKTETPIWQRSNFANDLKADVFISLHLNSHADSIAYGFEVFTSPGQTDADLLAEMIIDQTVKAGVVRKLRADESDGDRDKERSDLAVLNKTNMPAVLIEFAFISNYYDLHNFMAAMETYLTAIVEGVKRYGTSVASGRENVWQKESAPALTVQKIADTIREIRSKAESGPIIVPVPEQPNKEVAGMRNAISAMGGRKFLVAALGLAAVVLNHRFGLNVTEHIDTIAQIVSVYVLGESAPDIMSRFKAK